MKATVYPRRVTGQTIHIFSQAFFGVKVQELELEWWGLHRQITVEWYLNSELDIIGRDVELKKIKEHKKIGEPSQHGGLSRLCVQGPSSLCTAPPPVCAYALEGNLCRRPARLFSTLTVKASGARLLVVSKGSGIPCRAFRSSIRCWAGLVVGIAGARKQKAVAARGQDCDVRQVP